jgi:bla regulator protein blaR1
MIYVWHHAVALAIAVIAGHALATARWTYRAPHLAVLVWQATAASVLTATIGLLLSIGLIPYELGVLPALGRLTADIAAGTPPHGLTGAHFFAVISGLVLLAAALAVQAHSSWEIRRHRARHRLLLRLVARPDAQDRALVLDHPAVVAYYLPGQPGLTGSVVVSSGALNALSDAELAAVLAHEHAHARERHDLVLAPFHALHRAIPCSVTARVVACVELLVEMRADDAAARHHGSGPLIAALCCFHERGVPPAPRGAIAAADSAVTLRVARLNGARLPIRAPYRWALVLTALTVAATPVSLFVLPV